ncbi:hypothetical protein ACOJVU_10900 [Mycobacterium sp. THU-M104]|uniref:hypothetical protein n=1 Tax=Mycobacterium sp. THU-M104 TaxID=3410515 RepID=UPI003B9D9EB7
MTARQHELASGDLGEDSLIEVFTSGPCLVAGHAAPAPGRHGSVEPLAVHGKVPSVLSPVL